MHLPSIPLQGQVAANVSSKKSNCNYQNMASATTVTLRTYKNTTTVGNQVQNHYPRFRGAPSGFFKDCPQSRLSVDSGLAVSREHPGLGEGIGDGLAQRYLKETGEASRYEDARSGEGRRRLSVCARDVYRLVDRFRGTAVAKMEEYGLLERLLHEQCHVGRHRDGRPGADDDDAEEGKVPVALREPKEVRSSSMQTPHDPEVTYSGHKGKGYEVQVSETCEEGTPCR